MYRSRLLALAALACFAAAVCAQKADKKEKAEPQAEVAPTPDVVAVADSLAKALQLTPDGYLLSPDRYRSLQEELARLRLLEKPAVQTPTELVLKGKVEGNFVSLTALYRFQTDRPGTIVRLGGSPAQATGVSLDGKTPRLTAGKGGKAREDDGFSVQIDRPDSDAEKRPHHELTLDLVLPVLTREREDAEKRPAARRERAARGQGFTLDLPRAPITRVEIELPPGSRDVYANGKALGGPPSLKGNLVSLWVGTSEQIKLDWTPAQAAASAAVLTADGTVTVRLDKKQTVTEAVLKLGVESGQTKAWRLVVPPGAELSFPPGDKERVERVDSDNKDPKKALIRTIHLKQASAEPLGVTVTVTAGPARPGTPVSVGPFNVVGVARQQGNVLVSCAVAEWHVEPAARGDLTRRAASEAELRADPALAAAFRYGPGGSERQTGQPWLDLGVESVSGQLKAKPAYVWTGRPAGKGGLSWRLEATLTVTPRRAGIDRFKVSLPPGCVLQDGIVAPDHVGKTFPDAKPHEVEFRLHNADAETVAPVTIKFEAALAADPDAEARAASLPLPQLHNVLEQDGTVTLRVPASAGVELLPPDDVPAGSEPLPQSAHELTYRYARRAPAAVAVRWRPYRPVAGVDSLVDLTLAGGGGHVRQELRHQLPAGALAQLRLRVPEAAANFRVVRGGQGVAPVGGVATVPLTPGAEALVVEYEFALPEPGEPLPVPLAQPEGDCRGETRVRVWAESGTLPRPPLQRGWLEQNLEAVPGRDRLPVLVLRSPRLDAGLTLRTAAEDAAARPLVERAVVRVEVRPDGEQLYHVRYRLGHLSGRQVEVQLPAPAAAIALACTLDGRRVDYEVDSGKVRLRLDPRLIRRPSVLELSYQLSPNQVSQTALTTTLLPPRMSGEAGFPSRWSVSVPDGWVVVGPEPGAGSAVSWWWRKWMLVPRAAASAADVEAWFSGAEAAAEGPAPALAPWREAHEPLRLTHVPRQPWLVGCSLAVVVLGLAVIRLALSGGPRRAALAWALTGLVALGGLGLAVLAPALAAQVAYGCEPGLLVLGLLAVIQWLLHERARRQTVYLPSFTRPRQGSSLARREAARAPGEPSTVDAPRRGSSLERGV